MNKLFPIVLALMCFGCDEDPVHGCSDSKATNYNPKTTIDNNSCMYDTKLKYAWARGGGTKNNFNIIYTTDLHECERAYPLGYGDFCLEMGEINLLEKNNEEYSVEVCKDKKNTISLSPCNIIRAYSIKYFNE